MIVSRPLRFREDESGVQEILGFMLALGAVMVLFGASVGYGVTVRDERIEDAAELAIHDTALRLANAINEADAWAARYPASELRLHVSLAQMPGPTGFIAAANQTFLWINASTDSTVSVIHLARHNVTSSLSGNPTEALVRYVPAADVAARELPGVDIDELDDPDEIVRRPPSIHLEPA